MASDLLADVAIRNAKPKAKPYKLNDGKGLFLLVGTGEDQKWWRFKYQFQGKEKLLSLGTYPEVGLGAAREKRNEARSMVAAGIDPSQARKEKKLATANTFESVARDWLKKIASNTYAATTLSRLTSRLEADVFPFIGNRPIAELRPSDIARVLERIHGRGTLETAHRMKTACSQIFRFAVGKDAAERDLTVDLRGLLPTVKYKHRAAITDPAKIAGLLRAIDAYDGSHVVKSAMQLAPLTFVRPGELRQAEWSEFDFEAALWSIPAERMKMKEPHLVPLSKQALAILTALHPLTGHGQYLFPSGRSITRPMSDNAVNAALRRMGFEKDEMTGHGFRAMARTVLDEVLHQRVDIVEHQLAHAVKDPLGRAYNRTSFLPERVEMMQLWSDYLDSLKSSGSAKVIPLKRAAGG